jgi:signal transduction histidine kinase
MDNIQQIIILSTCIFLLAPLAIVIYITIYHRRKKRHMEEKEYLKNAFQQELLKTQIEVQEQTLYNVGQEIHDNITQVLSFVKLNLALIANAEVPVQQQKISESRELIARAIGDLRHLSKSLSFEHIMRQGLINALEVEAERINNSSILKVGLKTEGAGYSLGGQRELVLFRIFQEALNNTLKHATASRLNVTLQYSEQLFNLTLEDDGVGFSPNEQTGSNGLGLKNMQNRAAMMGAMATIYSSPGNGCSINVTLKPNDKQFFADGNLPNSFS